MVLGEHFLDFFAESRILPDLAHDVMLDTGWRQAADTLLEWLVRTL